MNWWKNPSNGSLKDFGYKGLVTITLTKQIMIKTKPLIQVIFWF
jgi:hypothetical protein